MENQVPLLEVRQLQKHFPVKQSLLARWSRKEAQAVQAVDGVSFTLAAGETLALVGESGCGKSTTGRALLRLTEPTGGEVLFEGVDMAKQSKQQLKALRKHMQIIFQDPYASLHPRMTVREILLEPFIIHRVGTKETREARVEELLTLVGLAHEMKQRYPHEFSGGQRQRIGIAKALALQPKLIVCDEAVSALDVSVQANIINLLKDVQHKLQLTYLFISHDLTVVQNISTRVAVMYLGKIVEIAPTATLFSNPRHPYTKALLSSQLRIEPHVQPQRLVLEGEMPSALQPPTGCRFHTRCPYKQPRCVVEEPALDNLSSAHAVACFYV